jgi:hypothetical protein
VAASSSAFISYRRESGYAWAKLVWDALDERGVDVFLDLESLRGAGTFDVKVLNQIAGRPYFVPVLTKGALERCVNPGDWLWREIEHAVTTGRIFVPLIVPPFTFDEADRCLSAEATQVLRSSNGVQVVPDYFDAAIDRLVEDRLVPAEVDVDPLTAADHAFADEAIARAKSLDDEELTLQQAVLAGRLGTAGPAATAPPAPPPPPPAPSPSTPSPSMPSRSAPPPPPPAASSSAPPEAPPQPPSEPPAESSSAESAPASAVEASAPVAPPARRRSADGRGTRRALVIALGLVVLVAAAAAGFVLLSGDDGPSDELRSGGRLDPGELIETDDHRHVLEMTDDGVLQASSDGSVWWRPAARTVPGSVAEMQRDGNLVVYPSKTDQSASNALWHSSTHGNPGAFLVVGDDGGRGFVEIRRPDGEVLWRQSQDGDGVVEPEQRPMTEPGNG